MDANKREASTALVSLGSKLGGYQKSDGLDGGEVNPACHCRGCWQICSMAKVIFRSCCFAFATILLSACHQFRSYTSVYGVLEQNGFQQEHFLISSIPLGGVEKNINQDIPGLMEVLKRSTIVAKLTVSPKFSIFMASGSSFESQTIQIHVDETGSGFVDYMGGKIFFRCPDLPAFCSAAFERSRIIIGRPTR